MHPPYRVLTGKRPGPAEGEKSEFRARAVPCWPSRAAIHIMRRGGLAITKKHASQRCVERAQDSTPHKLTEASPKLGKSREICSCVDVDTDYQWIGDRKRLWGCICTPSRAKTKCVAPELASTLSRPGDARCEAISARLGTASPTGNSWRTQVSLFVESPRDETLDTMLQWR